MSTKGLIVLLQNSIQMIRGRLAGLENEVQSLYDKAEALDYEVTLFEQKIPSLKNLLASKFGIGTNTLPIAGSDNPDSSKGIQCSSHEYIT